MMIDMKTVSKVEVSYETQSYVLYTDDNKKFNIDLNYGSNILLAKYIVFKLTDIVCILSDKFNMLYNAYNKDAVRPKFTSLIKMVFGKQVVLPVGCGVCSIFVSVNNVVYYAQTGFDRLINPSSDKPLYLLTEAYESDNVKLVGAFNDKLEPIPLINYSTNIKILA